MLVILVAIVQETLSDSANRPPTQQEVDRRVQELRKLGIELREAILNRDTETLLKYIEVGPNGFESHEAARTTLQMRTSSVSCLLFDTKCLEGELRRSGGEQNPFRISVQQFFKNHPKLRIEIHFFGRRDPEQGVENVLDLAQILYIVPGSAYDIRFPHWLKDRYPQNQWGKQYVEACMKHTLDGWRYYSGGAGVFVCWY